MDDKNQFDFILDPAKTKPAGPAFLGDPKKQMMVAAMFVVGVLLLVVIAFAIFSSLGKKNSSAAVEVIAYQTEIARIAELGLSGSVDPAVLSQISTMSMFIQSDLAQTTAYVTSTGKELTELETTSKLDVTVEESLTSASLKNTYDEELLSILDNTTAEYKLALQRALDSASSEEDKAIFQAAAVSILTYEAP